MYCNKRWIRKIIIERCLRRRNNNGKSNIFFCVRKNSLPETFRCWQHTVMSVFLDDVPLPDIPLANWWLANGIGTRGPPVIILKKHQLIHQTIPAQYIWVILFYSDQVLLFYRKMSIKCEGCSWWTGRHHCLLPGHRLTAFETKLFGWHYSMYIVITITFLFFYSFIFMSHAIISIYHLSHFSLFF